ncbi:hypothetical protein [Limosilactobacillus galli]|uniref:hypothetical protein n=1 Tax=Limosilactobacillus galli TaxID=2991834 RepID=UPI0024BB4795|nr:hypothetical protein [Limosilactobacillus galli]
MTTRSEIRAQREAAEQASTPPVSDPEPAAEKSNHFFNLWGTIFLILFILSAILNATILNPKFVLHEVRNSVVETTITDQVNGALERYGVPTSVLTDKDTDRLLNQAVNQVYAGKNIHLDLSTVTQRAGAAADSQLAQYGLAGVGSAASSALSQNINSVVNGQLNTPAVARLANGIHLAKVATNMIFTVTGIGLMVLAVLAVLGRHFAQSFSRMGIWTVIIDGALCGAIGKLAPQLAADQPDYTAFVAQLSTDFMRTALTMIGMVLVVTIILLIWRIFGRRLLSRR